VGTYIVRRLLLMVPTIFLISAINFAIINAAPAPRLSNVGADGIFDKSASAEANEGEFIFRQTFALDKPVFWNTRYALEDGEILWRVSTFLRPWELPKDRRAHRDTLIDYGRTIIPHLVRIAAAAAEGAPPEAWAEDYARRWEEARGRWMAAGRPPDASVTWPPPPEPPPFDAAWCARLARYALDRLASNAPRRPLFAYGEDVTDAVLEANRAIRREAILLRSIWNDDAATDLEKAQRWREWYEGRKGEWEYSPRDKLEMFLGDTRFANFWDKLLSGDLGTSFKHRKKVWTLIFERLHISLTLSFGSLMLAYLISIPLGILSAVTHRSMADRITSVALFALYSLPTMFLGVLLLQYFALKLDWAPVSGFASADYAQRTVLSKLADNLGHLALPLATMTVGAIAYLSRIMKSGLIETVRSDFVRTARAKGLSEFVVVMKHAVRNSLIPIITILGASLPALIGGSVIVEYIFGIEGMGKLAFDSVTGRDYGVIMGINILAAVLTMIGVFLADLCYAIVDPRISYR